MALCGAPHPETGKACTRPEGEYHDLHVAGAGTTRLTWPSTMAPPPPREIKRDPGERDAIDRGRQRMKEIAKQIPPERRSVGVLNDDPEARMEGAEAALNAAEPEFVSAAINGATALCMTLQRWTADDLWEWLDEHDYHTEHPKAMTGILRKIQGKEYRLIRPVDTNDPDAYRTPRRSNESRLLRVYESLCFAPSASYALRNFE